MDETSVGWEVGPRWTASETVGCLVGTSADWEVGLLLGIICWEVGEIM